MGYDLSYWKERDRTVHCTIVPGSGERVEIVRYDRAGKWWYESGKTRKPLTLDEAVKFAADTRPAVVWHEGRRGGLVFDSKVRKARQTQWE